MSRDTSSLSDADVAGVFQGFVGEYEQVFTRHMSHTTHHTPHTTHHSSSYTHNLAQVVPHFSAVHVQGEALYKTAQKGIT